MSTTTYRPTEVGNLYVGDVVSLPGDILATVTGFDFTDLHDRPGYVGLQFDGFAESRLYATTDILDVEVTTADDDDDVCSECHGTGVVYDASYGCDCRCGSCYDGDADTFEAALWRATAPRPR